MINRAIEEYINKNIKKFSNDMEGVKQFLIDFENQKATFIENLHKEYNNNNVTPKEFTEKIKEINDKSDIVKLDKDFGKIHKDKQEIRKTNN